MNAYQRRPPETKDVGLNAPNIVFPICVDWVMERNFEEALIKSREEQQRTYEERGAAHLKTQLKGNGIKLKMEIFLLLKHHRRR